jgi:hypothetical protein
LKWPLQAAAGLFALTGLAHAEPGFDGTLSLRADAWSGERQLTDRHGAATVSAWASATLDGGEAGRIVGSGWLAAEHGTEARRSRVRELYWRADAGPFNVRVGRQIIVWGRADGFNPTDNLAPRDFTLLVPEDGEARRGNDAVNVSASTGIGTVSLIGIARAASHTIPLPAMPGVRYVLGKSEKPTQWAAKWEGQADGIDGSLSYFDGADPMPTLLVGAIGAQGIDVLVRSERMRIFGGDVSLTRNGTIWRAEAAVARSDSAGAMDFSRKKSQWWVVGGGEWQFDDGVTLGLQATLQHVDHFASPDQLPDTPLRELAWRQLATSSQTSANQAGVIWRLAQRSHSDALLLELNGIAMWPTKSGLARAKAVYSVNNHVQLLAGADYYFGKQHSFFGQLQANRLAYVQVRYGF